MVLGPGSLYKAAVELIDWLKLCTGCARTGPELVIGFDESHELMKMIGDRAFSLSSELRRSMRPLRSLPIFGVMLATGGNIVASAPPTAYDPSARVRKHTFNPVQPSSLMPFDVFVDKIPNDGSWTLQRLASTFQLTRFGRPLYVLLGSTCHIAWLTISHRFGAMYDAGDAAFKRDIVSFSAVKLFAGEVNVSLSSVHELVGICQTLCLDFRPGPLSGCDAQERYLAEQHLRLILSMVPGTHSIATLSPSEPLLAEAVYNTFSRHGTDVPKALLHHIEHSRISAGDRGEIVGALVLLLAINKARQENPKSSEASQKEDGYARTVSVPDFLRQLIPTSMIAQVLDVDEPNPPPSSSASHPSPSPPSPRPQPPPRRLPVRTTFARSRIYVTHWIQVDDKRVLDQKYLWALYCRGGAVICRKGQNAVDLIIPILMDDKVCSDNISVILIQVKNDKNFTDTLNSTLFDNMDPVGLGIFKAESKCWPIIRMVFALAADSSTATVKARAQPERHSSRLAESSSEPKIEYYDLWFAGATSNTFQVIDAPSAGVYAQLLERTYSQNDKYALDKPVLKPMAGNVWERTEEARRRMNPGAEARSTHFGHVDFNPVAKESSTEEPVEEDTVEDDVFVKEATTSRGAGGHSSLVGLGLSNMPAFTGQVRKSLPPQRNSSPPHKKPKTES